jgi:hypothetical protein
LLVNDEAEARVCGQSGVSGKCATYDCDEGVWGWCWYATGCCAGGALKKICDCCSPVNNVHGYCPSGTNVLCIVESCGADPRLQVVPIRRIPTDDPVAIAAGASRSRFAEGGAAEVWLVHPDDALLAAVLAPPASWGGRPLLLAAGANLGAPLVAELQRLGTRKVVLHGPNLSLGIDQDLARYAITTERANQAATGPALVAVADRYVADAKAAGIRRAFCVEPAGFSLAMAAVTGAAAATNGNPVIIGADRAASAGMVLTYMAGPEAAANAGKVPGGNPMFSDNPHALSSELADAALRIEPATGGRTVGLLPETSGNATALLATGGPIFSHAPGTLDGIRDALFSTRDRIRAVAAAGSAGALSTAAYYELQSIVNGFEAHKLIGVSGQGLPVIDQPASERPIGLARRSNTPPEEASQRYWTGRGLELGP